MRETAHNDYFWVYIVVSIVFVGIAVYLMPKLIRFLDESADRFVEKKVKRRRGDEEATKKRKRTALRVYESGKIKTREGFEN